VAQVITNKYRNRECIKGLSELKSPRYIEATTLKEIEVSDVPYPMILKPINLGGKRGITVVNDARELSQAFYYAQGCFRKGTKPKIIAEQFLVGGMECSVESITYKGKHTIIQITQKDSSGAPHCVELGHHQPAPLSKEIWNKVVYAVSSGLTAIGVTNGPCHTEIKIIGDEVYLIEFNARPGGDHIWCPMVELSTGFDIFSAIAQTATGELESIDVTTFKHNYSGLYYVVAQTAYLKSIFDTCEKEPWCVERHFITNDLPELTHNDVRHTNYILYSSPDGDPVVEMLKKAKILLC
jgi:biotin carboxylase